LLNDSSIDTTVLDNTSIDSDGDGTDDKDLFDSGNNNESDSGDSANDGSADSWSKLAMKLISLFRSNDSFGCGNNDGTLVNPADADAVADSKDNAVGSNSRDWIDACRSSRLLQPLLTDAAATVDVIDAGADVDASNDTSSETGDDESTDIEVDTAASIDSADDSVKLMTEETVTQSKPNTLTATAALAHKLRIKARLSYYTTRLNSLMAH